MYIKKSGEKAREWIKEGYSKTDVIKHIKSMIQGNLGFRHVNNSENTMDIGAGSGRDTYNNSHFRQSFVKFQEINKYLNGNDSIEEGKKGEYLCYHAVFR